MVNKPRSYIFVASVFFYSFSFSTELRIKLFSGKNLYSISVLATNSKLIFQSDSTAISVADSLTKFSFFSLNDSVLLKSQGLVIGKFKSITMRFENNSEIKMDVVLNKKVTTRTYDGMIEIKSVGENLMCINIINIEKYIPGVIQAEVGKGNSVEFNKVKAIIVRTYALSNMRKHELEGCHLCDDVHCQVYRGKSVIPNILTAVKETESMVLVDTSLQLVNAAFHANCGGQTCNSEDVWQKPLPYLRSVTDSFCVKVPDHYWQKKIPKTDWFNYLQKKYNLTVTDSLQNVLLNFDQPQRKVYFLLHPAISLKSLREDWKLRSTWFSVKLEGEMVVLTGYGFGHGVGLCQQGAMQMSKKGYGYRQIIDFYFSNVTLINYAQLNFFFDN
jgi:stage II sporulation protein D